jgi:hypothetical protein
MQHDPLAIARASYQAYADKDRAAIEALIADDFHFTSPLDNRIDRKTYFTRCWPNSAMLAGFDFIHLVPHGDRVFEAAAPGDGDSATPRSSPFATASSSMPRSISDGRSRTRRRRADLSILSPPPERPSKGRFREARATGSRAASSGPRSGTLPGSISRTKRVKDVPPSRPTGPGLC